MPEPNEEWPLIGLHDETLLPGEERTYTAPALDVASTQALAGLVGKAVVVLTVTSAIELPGLAAGRFGTFASVVSAGQSGTVLRGERRVRIGSARGAASPFTAVVAPVVPAADVDREARV